MNKLSIYLSILSSEYTKDELRQLHSLAKKFLCQKSIRMYHCEWLYRDAYTDYFETIERENNNIMKVKTTENKSGDPASPMKGALEGVFFFANVDIKTGKPYQPSNFGPRRLLAPATAMFDELQNLYFADFFCMVSNYEKTPPHYVTLVMARPGSDADRVCQEKLIAVDRNDNIFLCFRNGSVSVASWVWVEILYTEDFDINMFLSKGGRFDRVEYNAHESKYLQKNPGCNECNL